MIAEAQAAAAAKLDEALAAGRDEESGSRDAFAASVMFKRAELAFGAYFCLPYAQLESVCGRWTYHYATTCLLHQIERAGRSSRRQQAGKQQWHPPVWCVEYATCFFAVR